MVFALLFFQDNVLGVIIDLGSSWRDIGEYSIIWMVYLFPSPLYLLFILDHHIPYILCSFLLMHLSTCRRWSHHVTTPKMSCCRRWKTSTAEGVPPRNWTKRQAVGLLFSGTLIMSEHILPSCLVEWKGPVCARLHFFEIESGNYLCSFPIIHGAWPDVDVEDAELFRLGIVVLFVATCLSWTIAAEVNMF